MLNSIERFYTMDTILKKVSKKVQQINDFRL